MPERAPLAKEEFLALSNQKADDWREITRISVSFLGVAGAFFTAGVAKGSAWVIVLSPIPLLLGVLQMTKNARLQLQMITYLNVFSPFEDTSWERDIAKVRPVFWKVSEHGRIASRVERIQQLDGPDLARHLTHPSQWDVWLFLTLLVGTGVDAIPLIVGFEDGLEAFLAGMLTLIAGSIALWRDIRRIEPERGQWEELWKRYRHYEIGQSD